MDLFNQNLIKIIAKFLCVDDDVARYYCQIVSGGPIVCQSDIEQNFIKELQKTNLVAEYLKRDNQKLFFAIDPNFSFPALVLHEMWECDSTLHTFQDLLDSEGNDELKDRLGLCNEIVYQTSSMFDKSLPFLEEDVIVIEGKQQISSYISGLINNTAQEIKAAVSPPHLFGEIVWQAIVNKMRDGLKYQRVSDFSELCRHGFKIYSNEVTEYNETIYIFKDIKLPQKFYIINDTIVLFFTREHHRAQVIKNEGITKRYISKFDDYRTNSIELKGLLPLLLQLRNDRLVFAKSFLSEEELTWFAQVFDYGCFLVNDEFSQDVVEKARQKCLQNNLIEEDEICTYAKYTLEDVLKYDQH